MRGSADFQQPVFRLPIGITILLKMSSSDFNAQMLELQNMYIHYKTVNGKLEQDGPYKRGDPKLTPLLRKFRGNIPKLQFFVYGEDSKKDTVKFGLRPPKNFSGEQLYRCALDDIAARGFSTENIAYDKELIQLFRHINKAFRDGECSRSMMSPAFHLKVAGNPTESDEHKERLSEVLYMFTAITAESRVEKRITQAESDARCKILRKLATCLEDNQPLNRRGRAMVDKIVGFLEVKSGV